MLRRSSRGLVRTPLESEAAGAPNKTVHWTWHYGDHLVDVVGEDHFQGSSRGVESGGSRVRMG